MLLIGEENKSIKMNVNLNFEDSILINGTTVGVYTNVFNFNRLDLVEIWGFGDLDLFGRVSNIKLVGQGILGQSCYRDKDLIPSLNS